MGDKEKKGKDEDEEVKDGEAAPEGGEEAKKEEKKPFKLGAGVVSILKNALLLLGVAIIAFVVAYFTSNRGGQEKSLPKDALLQTDPETGDVIEKVPKGADWSLDEMIINTSDEDESHIVRARIVVSHNKDDKDLLAELNDRRTQIHSTVRNIIGEKKFVEIRTTRKQRELAGEIKAAIQKIVHMEGIYEVYFKEFTVH